MSTTHTANLISEAAAFRKLDVSPRRGVKLRAAGVIVPTAVICSGRLRLYRIDELPAMAAAINPTNR